MKDKIIAIYDLLLYCTLSKYDKKLLIEELSYYLTFLKCDKHNGEVLK